MGATVTGELLAFAAGAVALVAFTVWALYRARRMVEKDRHRTGGPP